MGSSAILRRWISGVGIIAKNRMMSTATSAPWLMLPAAVDGGGNMDYTFQSLAKEEEVTYKSKMMSDGDIIKDVRFVGSSHGWLALHNLRNKDLFLSNPITDRHIKLPPLPTGTRTRTPRVLDRVSLSSPPEEEGCLAFLTFDGKKLGFCSPRRSNEWTFFGGLHGLEYDDVVYSSRHKRLFCVTHGCTNLEGWDIEGENQNQNQNSPRCDWTILHNKDIDYECNWCMRWPDRDEIKRHCEKVKYLIVSSDQDLLYVVVRHVNPVAGPNNSLVDKIVFSEFQGRHFIRNPYKTIDFDVFKVDWRRGDVAHMDGLEGMAMFVGINSAFAIRASRFPGVKANSIYFTDDNRLAEPTRMARTNYGGHDNGVYDYECKDFSPCSSFYPVDYDKIRKVLPLPLWFNPNSNLL